MVELQIVTQILVILVLVALVVLLTYVVIMLHKVNKKLDTILEIITFYEKVKAIVEDFINGPGKAYFEIGKSVFSFVLPLLTNKRKSK